MRVAILVPFYKLMDVGAVASLITMLTDIKAKGDDYVFLYTANYNIVASRELLFTAALSLEDKGIPLDYLLSIDTDHIYESKVLYGLIERMHTDNLQMLSAAYNARGCADMYAHCRYDSKNDLGKIAINPEQIGVIDCDTVGFGFVLLRPGYVRDLRSTFGRLFMWDSHGGGEDVFFCNQVKKIGGRVCFDASQKIKHLSTMAL